MRKFTFLIQKISDRNLSSAKEVRRIHSALSFGEDSGDLDAFGSVLSAGDDDRLVGRDDLAARERRAAKRKKIVDVFPSRAGEIKVLRAALAADEKDGFAAYLLTCWVALEPTWGRRVLNLVLGVMLVRIYFLAPAPEAYNEFLPLLVIMTICYSLLSVLSLTRFRDDRQD